MKIDTSPIRRLFFPVLLLLAIVVSALFAYTRLEGISLADSAYMIVITLSTVGFKEVQPLSPLGKLITSVLIISGVGTALYTAGQVGEMIIEGQIFGYRRRKRMEKKIREMKDHYIICGFGRVGHQVAADLEELKEAYLVIDVKEATAEELEERGIPYIIGDVASDDLLERAGAKRAKGLVACNDSDVANLYVTLSARALNPEIYIVSRASTRSAEDKLRIAGANRVISPYLIAGKKMAEVVLKYSKEKTK